MIVDTVTPAALISALFLQLSIAARLAGIRSAFCAVELLMIFLDSMSTVYWYQIINEWDPYCSTHAQKVVAK